MRLNSGQQLSLVRSLVELGTIANTLETLLMVAPPGSVAPEVGKQVKHLTRAVQEARVVMLQAKERGGDR